MNDCSSTTVFSDQRSGGELTAGSQVTTRREAQTAALGGLSTHLR